MRTKFVTIIFLIMMVFLSRSSVFALTGEHSKTNEKGECATCHIPHNAKGDKIWSIALYDEGNPPETAGLEIFTGIRQLCESCHDGSDATAGTVEAIGPNERGLGNVFMSLGEDHVMHGGAIIKAGPYNVGKAASLRTGDADDWDYKHLDKKFFPLDPNDIDTVPTTENGNAHPNRNPMDYNSGGEGFYCGSCHDVHNDFVPGESNYLRYYDDALKGDDLGVRKIFCSQCHGIPHAKDHDCMYCHAPHRGATKIDDNEVIGRWVLVEGVTEKTFASLGAVFPDPNLPGSKDENLTPLAENPSMCYGCHNPKSNYGDDIATINADNYHHPMGKFATKEDNLRAPGTTDEAKGQYPGLGAWDQNLQLNCLSCHFYHDYGDNGDKNDNNSYLRWNFKNDSAEFCVKCHNDKKEIDLGDLKEGHRQAGKSTPLTDRRVYNNGWKTVESSNCMFCHYIHDGTTKGKRYPYDFVLYKPFELNHTTTDSIPAELDALMRVPAKVLLRDWADNSETDYAVPRPTEPLCYEDMCYGCHGRESIVGGDGDSGSLLRPDIYFSHRYAADPNQKNNPYYNMGQKKDGQVLFPKAGEEAIDDYGVIGVIVEKEEGKEPMYCGSCHNVHNNNTSPYLNGEYDPYKSYNDPAQGFCQGCHEGVHGRTDEEGKRWIDKTHPVYEDANPPATTEYFYANDNTDNYLDVCDGGSGKKGAVFDGEYILCLSCHNIHAAMTSYDGEKAKERWDNPTSEYSKGGHGKLLVIDNNRRGLGNSDLCIQCHPM